jgi:hypothetical protein
VKEQHMVEKVQEALTRIGIADTALAAGLFFPRGHTGGAFVGGVIGGDIGDTVGGLAGGVGIAAGLLAGQHAADARSGLPERMMVAVSAEAVYGFDTHREHEREPTDLVFQVPRDGLEVKVHQRVNVRVLELIDDASGSRIELEGNRLPVTHSKDVIEALAE